MSFSDTLKLLLEIRDIQVKELSAKTGISKNTLDNYLSGQKSLPNAENAVKIAEILGVTVEYLIKGSGTFESKTYTERVHTISRKLQYFNEADLCAVENIVAAIAEKYPLL